MRGVSHPVSADLDERSTLARELRALREAASVHPHASLLLLTASSRLPFPQVPELVQVLPAWQWMLEGGGGGV